MNQQVNKDLAHVYAPAAGFEHQVKAIKNTRLHLKARVGRHHFALLRGYLEGIDLRILALRYLHADGAEAADLRIIKRILRWTIDELIVLARRHGQFVFARAIDIEPSRIQASGDGQTPSLDDFRIERDPDGFYNETELLELFRDEYPGNTGNRKEKRNARLRERQSEALRWLETQVTADPQMSDALAGWFPDMLAMRLNAAGITTIAELVTRINQRGMRWYVSIPKIGKEAALRILTWLEMNQGSLKYTFGQQVFSRRSDLAPEDLPQRIPCEGIVPFEYLKPRKERDGSAGINRAVKNRSTANTDIEAIQLWLDACPEVGGSTWLSYRREAERFLAWCVIERQKPLSSVDEADCLAYRQFLNDLGRVAEERWKTIYRTDVAQWIGRRGTSRSDDDWRPFDGSALRTSSPSPGSEVGDRSDQSETGDGVLALSSQRQSIIILKNLFSWLAKIRYLDYSPFDAIKPLMEQRPKVQVAHSFSASEWEAILRILESLPKTAHYFRLRFALNFAYGTGLRLSELVAARYMDLYSSDLSHGGKQDVAWVLRVSGKRSKLRKIPITEPLLREVHAYMAHRGYASNQEIPPETYLIGRLTDLSASLTSALEQRHVNLNVDKLSVRNLHQILKDFFAHVHAEMQASAPDSAEHILNASTHWLRHTHGMHTAARGVDINTIRANFGHESLDTVSRYIAGESTT